MLNWLRHAFFITCAIITVMSNPINAGVTEDTERLDALKANALEKCKADPKGDVCIELAYQYDLGNLEQENSNYLSVDLLNVACDKGNPKGCEKLKLFKINGENALNCYSDFETGEKCYSQGLIHLNRFRKTNDADEFRYSRYYFKSGCQRNHKKACEENKKLNSKLDTIDTVYRTDKSSVTLSMADNKVSGILIRGVIKKGDFDELESTIKRYKGKLGSVFLDSPGGDALEAMKIGRLIRELHLQTWAPAGNPKSPMCWGQNAEDKGKLCTCMSSCVLIHLAGVRRFGDILGVHRIYPNHELLKNLSAEDAKKLHELIKAGATKYFSDLEAPQDLLNMLLSIPSNEIKYLDKSEQQKFVPALLPEYQEWVLAKCGDLKAIDQKERSWMDENRSKFPKDISTKDLRTKFPEFKKVSTDLENAMKCESTLLDKLRMEAYSRKYGKG